MFIILPLKSGYHFLSQIQHRKVTDFFLFKQIFADQIYYSKQPSVSYYQSSFKREHVFLHYQIRNPINDNIR